MSPFFAKPSDALSRVGIALRVLIAFLVATLALTTGTPTATRAWLCVGLCALAMGSGLQLVPRWPRLGIVAEFALCSAAVAATGGTHSVLAALLIAPAFAGGVVGGLFLGVLLPVGATVGVVVAQIVGGDMSMTVEYAEAAAQWAGLGLLLGFLGAWSDRLVIDSEDNSSYATAHRLLSELHAITRRLPTGLDSRAIAAHMLDDLHEVLPFVDGTVCVHGRAAQLMPIASRTDAAIPAQGVDDDARPVGPVGPVLGSIDLPLMAGDRSIGVVTLTRGAGPASSAAMTAATRMLNIFATQLDAALLFDEVRELATVEERHRLARSIHDGIAQELVSVSYALDNAMGENDRNEMADQIAGARSELRRVLGELRLSIYELRSDMRPTASLATALSSYVHSIGRDWGMTIHVNATESKGRLSSECESELLRIAQEALTNARKHAAADNIWVTLAVEAPHAWLRIEDDGTGFANPHSAKSFGLHIMSERAARIGAIFRVVQRPARGTLVEVVLGQPTFAEADITHTVPVTA